MKLRLVRELPTGVLRRFPHMEADLRDLATRKEDFWQLCLDYQDLIHGLEGNPADREELVNLAIGRDEFTFGIRNGVVIADKGFSPNAKGKVKINRQQFYDAFFFGKDLPKDTHPTIKLVSQALEVPWGTPTPVVGR